MSETSWRGKLQFNNSKLMFIVIIILNHIHHFNSYFVFCQSKVWKNSCHLIMWNWLRENSLSFSQLALISILTEEPYLGKQQYWFHLQMKIFLSRLKLSFLSKEWNSISKKKSEIQFHLVILVFIIQNKRFRYQKIFHTKI